MTSWSCHGKKCQCYSNYTGVTSGHWLYAWSLINYPGLVGSSIHWWNKSIWLYERTPEDRTLKEIQIHALLKRSQCSICVHGPLRRSSRVVSFQLLKATAKQDDIIAQHAGGQQPVSGLLHFKIHTHTCATLCTLPVWTINRCTGNMVGYHPLTWVSLENISQTSGESH